QVLGDGEVGEDAAAFRDAAQPGARQGVGGGTVDVGPGHVHAAPRRAQAPVDGLQGRRLAGAVGPEQGKDAAFGYDEVHTVQDLDAPVGGVHVAELERGAHEEGTISSSGAASSSATRSAACTGGS